MTFIMQRGRVQFCVFRPVLMTACVASLGFVPMALATGTGAEITETFSNSGYWRNICSTLLYIGFIARTVPVDE